MPCFNKWIPPVHWGGRKCYGCFLAWNDMPRMEHWNHYGSSLWTPGRRENTRWSCSSFSSKWRCKLLESIISWPWSIWRSPNQISSKCCRDSWLAWLVCEGRAANSCCKDSRNSTEPWIWYASCAMAFATAIWSQGLGRLFAFYSAFALVHSKIICAFGSEQGTKISYGFWSLDWLKI